MSKTVITPEIEKFIRENYLKLPSREIAKNFGISKTAVLRFLRVNRLLVPKAIITEWRKRNSNIRPYTTSEQQYIIDNIATKSIKEIAAHLKRCNVKIRIEIKALGLQYIVDNKAKESRFKPGFIPANKGKKIEDYMSPETIRKFKANQYKKNHIPHNALADGTEVKRKDKSGRIYTLIKVPGKRKLQLKHRVVWEQCKGKIPKAHNIIFIDGDTDNFNIDNLKCISNKDLLRMNSLHNLPQEMQEILQLKGAITRQINKHNDNRTKKTA